jgi:hypothetical protein
MASTFGTLKTKISKKLIDASQTAISDSDVGDAINDALHFWKQKRFWFNEGQTTLTMDVNDPYVLGYGNTVVAYPDAPVLPSDFLYEFAEDGFVINYNNLSYRFLKVPPAQYDDQSVRGVGIPYIYTFRNGNYEFYFYPNIAYSLQVNYLKDYVDLVNTGDTNNFTAYADRLLMYEALSHLYGENRQDEEQGAAYAAKTKREYDLLKMRSGTNVTTGRLTVSSILG